LIAAAKLLDDGDIRFRIDGCIVSAGRRLQRASCQLVYGRIEIDSAGIGVGECLQRLLIGIAALPFRMRFYRLRNHFDGVANGRSRRSAERLPAIGADQRQELLRLIRYRRRGRRSVRVGIGPTFNEGRGAAENKDRPNGIGAIKVKTELGSRRQGVKIRLGADAAQSEGGDYLAGLPKFGDQIIARSSKVAVIAERNGDIPDPPAIH